MYTRLLMVATVAALVAGAPGALLAQEPVHAVSGVVRLATGAPLAGAAVSAGSGAAAETDDGGRFTLRLPIGRHALRVSHPACEAVTRGDRRSRAPRRPRHPAHSASALRGSGGRRGRARGCRRADDHARTGPPRDREPEHRAGDAVPAERGAVGHPVLGLRVVDGILVHLPSRHPPDADERDAGRGAAERTGGLGLLLRQLRRLRECDREPPGPARRRDVDGGRGLVRRLDQLRQHRPQGRGVCRRAPGRRLVRHEPGERGGPLGEARRRREALRPGGLPGHGRVPAQLGFDAAQRVSGRHAGYRLVVLQVLRLRRAGGIAIGIPGGRRRHARPGPAVQSDEPRRARRVRPAFPHGPVSPRVRARHGTVGPGVLQRRRRLVPHPGRRRRALPVRPRLEKRRRHGDVSRGARGVRRDVGRARQRLREPPRARHRRGP